MKKFGAYLSLIGLLSQATAPAWVGGPYSNNTYDGFDGGIFKGTIRGPSTSGIFSFSQGDEALVSPFGDSVVYNRGMAYYGECYGFVDFDSKKVSGITNGTNNGTNLNDPNSSPQFRNVSGFGFGVDNGIPGTLVGNQYAPLASGAVGAPGTNVGTANSSWNGKITKSKQTMRFRAKGEMSLFGTATQATEFNNVTSTGVFDNPTFDLDAAVNLIGTGNPPGTGTVRRVSGSVNNFPDIQSRIKIRVYGSRTSVAPAVNPSGYLG